MQRCLLLFLLASVFVASAQDYRASVTGQVKDRSGAAIPNVVVKAVQDGTNETVQTRSNPEGFYTLPYLKPGKYTIHALADGFNHLEKPGVVLMVNDKLDLPLVLEVGNMMQQVTVVTEQELLRSNDASGGTNFDSLQTEEYALNGRQVYMLMQLAPGVIFTQEEFGATGFSGTRGWDVNGSYVMNGGVQGTNQFLLNGAPISLTGSWQVAPNVEAIQEFKVMTNTYDAQYGRTGGGTVNTTLKSGSNAWHGSLFEYFRNSVLDANVTQNNRVGAPRGKHITHQFGGTAGGKLRKNTDFVFFSFEGFRERVPFPVVTDTPPLALRDGQHFSDYKINVFDPLTTRVCVKGVDTSGNTSCFGTYIRTQFAGNAIPKSRVSPIGEKILSLWPAPNYIGQVQNFIASANVGQYGYNQPMGRWDHYFSEKDRFYALITFQHGHEFRNQNGFASPLDTGNILTQRTSQNYIADWTHMVSSTAILDVRFSFGRFTSYFPDGALSNALTSQDLGIKSLPYAPTASGNLAPHFNLDQYTSIIGNAYNWDTSNQWDFAPSVNWAHGKHTTHYGAEFVYAGVGSNHIGRANGEFSFTRTWTQQYADRSRNSSDGSGVADLLLGIPGAGFIDYNGTFYRTWPYWAAYIQDDWRIAHNLTLNVGLRYDVQIPFGEQHDRVNSGFDFNAVNPLSDQILANWKALKAAYDATKPQYPYPDPPAAIYGGKLFAGNGKSRRTYGIDWTDIQPRIGLAWALASKMVLRTGAGIYYRTATQANITDGFSQRTNYIRSTDGLNLQPLAGLAGPFSLENPFPDGILAPTGSSLGLLTSAGQAVSYDSTQRVIPRTYQYSFGLQRRFPWNVLIDASYVGSQTVHDTMSYERDYITLDLFQQGHNASTLLNRNIPNPFYGILPQTTTFGGPQTISALNLNRPYPLFNGIVQNTNPWAKYRYDALQLRFEKLESWNLAEPPIYELSNYDKPQNIAFSGVWDLPFGRNRHWLSGSHKLVRGIVSGWNANWIYTYNSGYPVAVPNGQFSCSSYIVRPQTPDHWFNNDTSCYKSYPAYTLRGVPDRFAWIRNPAAPQLNVTLARTFRMAERYSLQLRGESFNVTNTPLFNGPTTDFNNVRFGLLPLAQRNFPRLVQLSAKVLF